MKKAVDLNSHLRQNPARPKSTQELASIDKVMDKTVLKVGRKEKRKHWDFIEDRKRIE